MTWEGDPRTSTAGWKKLRTRVLTRDRWICQICNQPGAGTVDHIIPASLGGGDDPANLQAVHDQPCHRKKTAAEANAAKAARRASRLRPPEPHPGLITPRGGTPSEGMRTHGRLSLRLCLQDPPACPDGAVRGV